MLDDLQNLDPRNFEMFIADLWEKRGWQTSVSKKGPDRGIDIMATRQSPYKEKVAIQAKRYGPNSKVGGPDIQQYSSIKQNSDIDQVVIVTTGDFTDSAKTRAQELNVKCINGADLVSFIQQLEAVQIVEEYTEDKQESDRSYSSKDPQIETPNFHIKLLAVIQGNTLADYSDFSVSDLNNEMRGSGLSEREGVILAVTSLNSQITFESHELKFISNDGHEYSCASPQFFGYFEQSLDNRFSRFMDQISPKQTKYYLCMTDTIPESVQITRIRYEKEYSFSLDFEGHRQSLVETDPNEVL